MRDPVIYRIRPLARTTVPEIRWCIYPMYDFAHPIEDALEGITHSLCTLEFEDHRPLYDWVIETCRPARISRGRSNLHAWAIDHTVMSKRKLRKLVEERLCLRLGRPAHAHAVRPAPPWVYARLSIRNFCERIGVSKVNSTGGLRLFGALPAGRPERARTACDGRAASGQADPRPIIRRSKRRPFEVENNPGTPEDGTRTVSFSSELWIEQDDFMEEPVKGYFRLFPGNEVRLKDRLYRPLHRLQKG